MRVHPLVRRIPSRFSTLCACRSQRRHNFLRKTFRNTLGASMQQQQRQEKSTDRTKAKDQRKTTIGT
jgi:hypothetical protein